MLNRIIEFKILLCEFSHTHPTNSLSDPRSFQLVTSNFNHERWFVVCALIGGFRALIEECFKWTVQVRFAEYGNSPRSLFYFVRRKCVGAFVCDLCVCGFMFVTCVRYV